MPTLGVATLSSICRVEADVLSDIMINIFRVNARLLEKGGPTPTYQRTLAGIGRCCACRQTVDYATDCRVDGYFAARRSKAIKSNVS